jgi:hypothetical protein
MVPPAGSHDAGSESDECPDNKAGGPKSHLSDKAIPEKVEVLSQFIDNTQELMENFHSRKANLASKDFDWQGS